MNVVRAVTVRISGQNIERRVWQAVAVLIGALAILPLASVCVLALRPSGDALTHLASTILPHAVGQTVLLMAGVAVLTLVAGAGTAWLITMYRFPGRDAFDWLMVLPLAIPTYITAYCYGEFLDFTGPLQTFIRDVFGFRSARDYWFPQWRGVWGAMVIMACVLYPYVYLTARASFQQQSVCVLEVARTLGRSGTGVFFSVALPLARPALAAGVSLALMECVNDLGAVEFLGVKTLTATVYATWLQRSDLAGAAQIAMLTITFVLALIALERSGRAAQRFHHTTNRYRALPRRTLGPGKALAAMAACLLPLTLGFIIPMGVLLRSAITYAGDPGSAPYWQTAANSVMIAGLAAFATLVVAWMMTSAHRIAPSPLVAASGRIASMGYAVPGTVIALGILMPLAAFDNGLDAFMRREFGVSTGLLLSGSVFAVVFACSIRFYAVAFGAIDAGYQQLSPNLDAAARSLGAGTVRVMREVHMPLLRPALGAAALLVFVDSMKELPATLLLRPFNFETLATQVYVFASLEQFEKSALSALTIVLLGLAPVLLLHRAVSLGRAGAARDPAPFNAMKG